MTNPKPKRWFQLSLTTCEVCVVVAGVLMWANLRPRPVPAVLIQGEMVREIRPDAFIPAEIEFTKYGWPATAVQGPQWSQEIEWLNLTVNIGIALAIFAVTVFSCECLVRRFQKAEQRTRAQADG